MSYIRASYPYTYVEGISEDYVFGTGDGKGNSWIEDYGYISDAGIIELLFDNWKTEDNEFKEHLLKRLAKKLNVKIREKPLEYDSPEWEKEYKEGIKKTNEECDKTESLLDKLKLAKTKQEREAIIKSMKSLEDKK